jgi:hypothetical protein
MTFIKRRLGRGLEVLLTDVSSLPATEQAPDTSNDLNDQLALAQALIENLERKNQNLLAEVEALRKFLVELESIIRTELTNNQTLAAEMIAKENN